MSISVFTEFAPFEAARALSIPTTMHADSQNNAAIKASKNLQFAGGDRILFPVKSVRYRKTLSENGHPPLDLEMVRIEFMLIKATEYLAQSERPPFICFVCFSTKI